MSQPRVLLFGGNGRIGRLMTTSMLSRSWHVTSVIRNPRQKVSLRGLARNQEQLSNLDILVRDLENMDLGVAERMLKDTMATCVIFTAGSMSNPTRIDRDAAKCIIKASVNTPAVTKFLMISFPTSRRRRAPWWDDDDYSNFLSERNSYPEIGDAKIGADEYLVTMTRQRESRGETFQAISLRPSWLTESPTGKVQLGKTKALGQVARKDVADVAVRLLSREDTRGWFDLVQGSDDIVDAVEKVVREKIDTIEGEDIEAMYKLSD
ncbi:uncharacterized protein PAC_19840 [Phialocephala subalpina]|uniref:NAD(P)-binding domain-containing protein n=1 Tax=Phialocephala subalpina TaxID=576137 RepID=A0A1L7XY55_9HELO|nr:uncharacterized protein PAC_19840 [Phialocephala subalpina]